VRKRATIARRVSLVSGLSTAPAAGTYVGTATYRADGESLGTVDLYATALPASSPILGVTTAPGLAVSTGF
jgi:hypothetical protein